MKPDVSAEEIQTIVKLIVDTMEKIKPIIGTPDMSPGIRGSFVIDIKHQPNNGTETTWVYDFHSEYLMQSKPSRQSVGFTMDDLTQRTMVRIVRLIERGEGLKPRRIGEVFTLEQFYEMYDVDATNQIRIERLMEILTESLSPSETFLQKVNDMWLNRTVGENPFNRVVYRC